MWRHIKRGMENLIKDTWSIITFFGGAYFVLSLLFPEEILKKPFFTIISIFLGGLTLLTIYDLIGQGLIYLGDRLAFYLSNIKEIEKLKHDVIQLQKEIEELKRDKK